MKTSRMIRFVGAYLVLMLLGFGLHAQEMPMPPIPPMPPAPMVPDSCDVNRMVNELKTELALSDKQTKEIASLYHKHFAQMRKEMEAQRKAMEAQREAHETARKALESSVNKVLNADQQAKLKQWHEAHKPAPRPEMGPKNGHRPHGGMGPRPEEPKE